VRIDLELCKRLERSEALAVRGALLHGARCFPERRIAVETIAGGTVAYAGADSPFTQATGIGIEGACSDPDLDRIVEFFHSRGAVAKIIASPASGIDFARLLARRGFEPIEYVNALAADLAQLHATRDARIEVCADAAVWAERSSVGFSDGETASDANRFIARLIAADPNVVRLALLENGEIVATGCLALEHGGIAALFGSSTLAQARRKGCQSAMIADRIARAREAGSWIARASALPATISERNFVRLGFTVVYTRTTWELPRPS